MIKKIRNIAFSLCLFVFLAQLGGGAPIPEGEGKLRVLVLDEVRGIADGRRLN